jgi:hypothetical protein
MCASSFVFSEKTINEHFFFLSSQIEPGSEDSHNWALP